MTTQILGDVIKCQECGRQTRSISRGCSVCGCGVPEPTFKHPMETTVTEKPEHIQQAEGLERLAAMLRENPDLAEHFRDLSFGRHYFGGDSKALGEFARIAVAYADDRKVAKDYSEKYAEVDATFGGVRVWLQTYREQVCERVVVGTETVTKKVKDPEALAAVPEIEVTETVEKVEWECKPLLAPTRDGAQ